MFKLRDAVDVEAMFKDKDYKSLGLLGMAVILFIFMFYRMWLTQQGVGWAGIAFMLCFFGLIFHRGWFSSKRKKLIEDTCNEVSAWIERIKSRLATPARSRLRFQHLLDEFPYRDRDVLAICWKRLTGREDTIGEYIVDRHGPP